LQLVSTGRIGSKPRASAKEADVKITLVLLAAYAIVGAFHSCREFYRGRKLSPEEHRHRWFMCGLTWLPTSIVFPFMPPPFGGSARIWRRENLKDSAISWLLFASIVSVGILAI
jgi:hypothetical protein